VLRRRVNYEQIRRIDPARFHDLEVTMKMLYDHGPENGQPGGPTFEIDQDFNKNANPYHQPQSFASTPVLKDPATSRKKAQNKPTPSARAKTNILASAANIKK
jgi:hypothetical protein